MIRILVGDLGGTNLRLAIVERDGEEWRFVAEHHASSNDYPGLLPPVQDFLASVDLPQCACIGVAGPVEVVGNGAARGRAHLSNLAWTVDATELARATGIGRFRIINDFEAIGYAVPQLGAEDVVEIHPGSPDTRGDPAPLAVIGPGTGLGQVFLIWTNGRYLAHPSEGGHADFAPSTPIEYELHAHLAERYGHVSVERVVSGPGIIATYDFLTARAEQERHPDVQRAMETGQAALEISRLALSEGDPASVATLRLVVRTLASQAAGFALTVRAAGGVYIAGGIAPKILDALEEGGFVETFKAKGRMSDLLARIPIRVIVAKHVGLLGAAVAAIDA
jgi:glucokinase